MANMSFGVNILPKANNTYTLGNSTYKWDNLYVNEINGQAINSLGLPSVTSTDNGKILKVDNGVWTVTSLPSYYTKPSGGIPATDLAETYLTSDATWNGHSLNTTSALSTIIDLYIPAAQGFSGNTFYKQKATSTPSSNSIPKYDINSYLYSTTPSANDNSTKVATTAYVDAAVSGVSGSSSVSVFTGATSSTAGIAGLVPAPTTTDITKFLRGDGTWAEDTWGGITYTPYQYSTNNEFYVPIRETMNGTSMLSSWVTSTPGSNRLAKYDANSYLYSTTPTLSDSSTKVATTAFVASVLPSTMTGATSSSAGTSGLVPAPTTTDVNKFLAGDGTYKSGGLPMVVLSYGNSTWNDFINAYNNNVIVYCRASSNSNPATGSQTRMAFMAYVNNSTTPTNVEFQYYRSMNPSNKSINQLSDQVFVYKLDKTSGWSVTTREASIKSVVFDASTGLTGTYNYSTGVLTITTAT